MVGKLKTTIHGGKKYLFTIICDLVEIRLSCLRGSLPIPIDYKELTMIAQVLELDKDELYSMWERRMNQVLETNGMNIYSNAALVNAMFDCAKRFIHLQ